MTFLEWKDSYNIGVKEIDIQHRGLFDLVSKLSNTKYFAHDEKYFFATLNMLVKYAELHFATEERYMVEAGYPRLEEHQKEHEKFLLDIFKLAEDLERGDAGLQQKILSFLHDWYSAHILGTDREYKECFEKKGFR
jgi:hemerythrin